MGDCLEEMKRIPDGAVDMVFADLPFGVTANKWDTIIPLDLLWEQLLRVGKKNCVFVFTATLRFALSLVASREKLFRYDLIWNKNRPSGFANAKNQPLRGHEHVLIFGVNGTYNPQKVAGKKYSVTAHVHKSETYGTVRNNSERVGGELRHPRSVVAVDEPDLRRDTLNGHVSKLCHPTQKPVALLEWLIKTYSNEGGLVLDPTMGSGTTGVACRNTGRHFIGIEKDSTYFATAEKRIGEAA